MAWALIAGLLFFVAAPALAEVPSPTAAGAENPYGGVNTAPVTRSRVAVTSSRTDVARAVETAGTRTVMVAVDSGTVSAATPSGQTLCFPRTKPYGRYDRCGTGACRSCGPCPYCAKDRGYVGLSLSAYPGLGFGIEFGKFFCVTPCVEWSWEVNLNYQDLTDGFNGIETAQNGKWMSARVGVKTSFFPQGRVHPTLRAGLGWAVATADTGNAFDIGEINRPEGRGTNYFGGYFGVGVEWDFRLWGETFTTGPEVYVFGGAGDQGSDSSAVTGTVIWHFLLRL